MLKVGRDVVKRPKCADYRVEPESGDRVVARKVHDVFQMTQKAVRVFRFRPRKRRRYHLLERVPRTPARWTDLLSPYVSRFHVPYDGQPRIAQVFTSLKCKESKIYLLSTTNRDIVHCLMSASALFSLSNLAVRSADRAYRHASAAKQE